MYSSFPDLIRTESQQKANGTISLETGLMAQKLTEESTTLIQTGKEITQTLLRGNINLAFTLRSFFPWLKNMCCDIVINYYGILSVLTYPWRDRPQSLLDALILQCYMTCDSLVSTSKKDLKNGCAPKK